LDKNGDIKGAAIKEAAQNGFEITHNRNGTTEVNYGGDKYPMQENGITHLTYDKNGKMIGATTHYEDDKIEKADMQYNNPDNGCSVQYNYKQEKTLNRSSYEMSVKNEKGEAVFNINRSFQKLNDNEYKSTLNGVEYDVTHNDEEFVIKKGDKETNVRYDSFIPKRITDPQERETLITKYRKLFKQLPGDILLQVDHEFNVEYGKNPGPRKGIIFTDDPTECYFDDNGSRLLGIKGGEAAGELQTSSDPESFLHELGHAISTKPLYKGAQENELLYSTEFNQNYYDEARNPRALLARKGAETVKYFTEYPTADRETVAETYSFINKFAVLDYKPLILDKQYDKDEFYTKHFFERTQLMVENMPLTVATVGNYFNDVSNGETPKFVEQYQKEIEENTKKK